MHINPFLKAYMDVLSQGQVVCPRGERILELENARITFHPGDSPLSSFYARHLNLNYCKKEFLWYLKADRFDDSILQHATMWKKLQQSDGGFNSNYGQYLFKGPDSQLNFVVKTLQQDRDSRQAVMVLLNQSHLHRGNTDIVCTYSIGFRIRNSRLNMTVNMRSNDLIFGTTNDVFCFAMIHRMLLVIMKQFYMDLELGDYVHNVDSLHCYEHHWEMLQLLASEGMDGFYSIDIPEMNMDDINWMSNIAHPIKIIPSMEFVRWINQ